MSSFTHAGGHLMTEEIAGLFFKKNRESGKNVICVLCTAWNMNEYVFDIEDVLHDVAINYLLSD